MTTRRSISAYLVLTVLMLGTLACAPLSWLLGADEAPQRPEREIEISEAAAERFEQRWEEVMNQEEGPRTLRFTEAELTSFLNLRLTASENSPIREPRVWFEEDQVVIQGTINPPGVPLSGDTLIAGRLGIEDGRVQVEMEGATMAGVAVPTSALEWVNDSVNALLAQSQVRVDVESFMIRRGEVEFVGR